jgi:hypothetical protein
MLDRIIGMQAFVRVAALGGLSGTVRSLNISPTPAFKSFRPLKARRKRALHAAWTTRNRAALHP